MMTVHEIAGILAVLGAGWPNWKMTDDTADVWADELATLDFEMAREAARGLLRTSEYAPTVAAFLEQYREIAYHRRIANPVPALPPGEDTEPDFDFEGAMADLRSKLTDWSTRGHNHKGPKPCPVCHPAQEPEPAA